MAKVIKLIELILTNFKGVQAFTLKADGNDLNVYGENAAGKTTLFDAFSWLLFGKDSQGNDSPGKWIKTLDANGEVIHKLNHTVEGVLDIDGNKLSLKKVFKEKWTRPRGTTNEVFNGHTTDYFINSVEHKEGEYNKEIASIIDEELFKLITNPSHFNEKLDVKKRREVLFKLFGDVTDDDVIQLKPSLSIVKQILNSNAPSEVQEQLKKDASALDKQIKDIPVQIKEQQDSIFGTAGGVDAATLEKQITQLRADISAKQLELVRVENGGAVADLNKQKLEIQNEQLELRNQLKQATSGDADKLRDRLSKLNNRYTEVQSISDRLNSQVASKTRRIAELEVTLTDLRQKRTNTRELTFQEQHIDTNCPTCNQSLPQDQIEQAHQALLEQFNLNKSKQLEDISTKGVAAKNESEALQAEVVQLQQEIASNEEGLSKLNIEIVRVKAELDQQSNSVVDYEQNEQYQALQKQINTIETDISSTLAESSTALDSIKTALYNMQQQLTKLEQDKASLSVAERARGRIDELKDSEKVLAKQYEDKQYQLSLISDFISTKAELVERRVNEKFPNVRFRLFERQVNGELKDTCETLYGANLVPYNGGLNRAAQMNAGLEVIKVLSEHYEVVAPIFIDNAEAATKIASTQGQQIKLIVSERDKWLWHAGSVIERSPEIEVPNIEVELAEIKPSSEQIEQEELF